MHLILCVKINRAIIGLVRGVKDYGSFSTKEGEECYKRHHIINSRSGETEPIFYSMTQDNTFGYLWLLSYNELYALQYTEEGTLVSVDIHDLVDTHMMYTKIMKDREGNLWLGSYDMAYTIFFDNSKIDNYPLPQLKNTWVGMQIS